MYLIYQRLWAQKAAVANDELHEDEDDEDQEEDGDRARRRQPRRLRIMGNRGQN